MPIVYKCRHCGQEIGKLNQQMVDTSMLGLDQLSSEEKRDMISYESNGDVTIKSICESCEESLGSHPQYHELDYFIQ
ncbi:anti-sigma-F factor Fin family protein [Lentibacillus sp. CBA3610]|uniref:anti-sigma-F factor Fin family protein n=1 Tax=Lentibacillus sp. CBA3610 TaxID=2518176 RepID=UPI0015962CA8|nr:anti-sigma-F factor Fin family protein [Lentibacillus sp. CBA3610]QKY70895.1 anti-sigma-F factor Fin family protein [Lentibacillus sp. CBA3610]